MCRFGSAGCVGWDEPGVAVAAEVDPPTTVMDETVVQPTQQHPVVEAGLAAFAPGLDVVGIAPGHRSPAPRMGTPTIADGQRFMDGGSEQSFGAPDIQRHTRLVDDHLGQRGIAGDQLRGRRGDRSGEPQPIHRLVTTHQRDRGSDEGDVGQLPTGHRTRRL